MTIEAKIICDSLGTNGVRLTTFVLKYPRFIHSEFMTHRAFSRNASSSRAIPFDKQMDMIVNECAKPLEFRANKKGMQAGEAIPQQQHAESIWDDAACAAINYAKQLAALGVHKQYVNRLVEPFAHISVVVSATEYSNFFALRHHSMAQPEIAQLAKQMWEAYQESTPALLTPGEWHLPFITKEETKSVWHYAPDDTFEHTWLPLIKMSVARCARVSYNNHDGTTSSYEQDCALYDRLLGAQPIHASPAEHQAEALQPRHWKEEREWYGNFRGWKQYRKTLEGENITEFKGP